MRVDASRDLKIETNRNLLASSRVAKSNEAYRLLRAVGEPTVTKVAISFSLATPQQLTIHPTLPPSIIASPVRCHLRRKQ